MKFKALSDKGKIRKINEDAYSVDYLSDSALYAIVCDGMGGANGGLTAASNACDIIADRIKSSYSLSLNKNSARHLINSAIETANSIIYDMSKVDKNLSGMGTTVVAALIVDNILLLAHAGDSRCYLLRHNELNRLTVDHSIVQIMVDSGQITEAEANKHPNKNVITRALGTSKDIDLDFNEIALQQNDIVLLCTDGLTNSLSEQSILDVLNSNNFEDIPAKLVEKSNNAGGGDNITAVVLSL